MSEKLPYEDNLEQQLNDLPLPDEEQSWEKMKLLLEKDDDRKVIPPFFFGGCLGWGLLLLVLLTGAWLIFRPEKCLSEKDQTQTEKKEQLQQNENLQTTNQETKKLPANAKKDEVLPHENTNETEVEYEIKKSDQKTTNEILRSENAGTGSSALLKSGSKKQNIAAQKNKIESGKRDQGITKINQKKKQETHVDLAGLSNKKQDQISKAREQEDISGLEKNKLPKDQRIPPAEKKSDESKPVNSDSTNMVDPGNKLPAKTEIKSPEKKDSSQKEENNQKKDSSQKKEHKFYFSAGLGIQQQIPLAGQKANPYNYYGRKGSLADYIPSMYVRLNRGEQWFIQSEFRYGAPQSVKEFSYSQVTKTVNDSSGGVFTSTTTTRTSTLKKTFYHQIPLSFNYFLRPNFSVGIGFQYSKFYGAVSENLEKKRNNLNQTETLTKKIEQVGSDSVTTFTSSQIHLVLQTEYRWKKFSFGFRYAKGVQPFIRYQGPNGEMRTEKNQSLNFIIRYRIWRSK